MQHFWQWLLHVLGVDSTTGKWYAWWSGAGSDVAEIGIIGAIVSVYRRHNCHVKRCFRLGRYPVEGTEYVTCRKHHPKKRPRRHKTTMQKIHEEYKKAREERDDRSS